MFRFSYERKKDGIFRVLFWFIVYSHFIRPDNTFISLPPFSLSFTFFFFCIHVRFVIKYGEGTRSYQVRRYRVNSAESMDFYSFVEFHYWNFIELMMNLVSSGISSLLLINKMILSRWWFSQVARVHSKNVTRWPNINGFEALSIADHWNTGKNLFFKTCHIIREQHEFEIIPIDSIGSRRVGFVDEFFSIILCRMKGKRKKKTRKFLNAIRAPLLDQWKRIPRNIYRLWIIWLSIVW